MADSLKGMLQELTSLHRETSRPPVMGWLDRKRVSWVVRHALQCAKAAARQGKYKCIVQTDIVDFEPGDPGPLLSFLLGMEPKHVEEAMQVLHSEGLITTDGVSLRPGFPEEMRLDWAPAEEPSTTEGG
jgi:hypothetical protein